MRKTTYFCRLLLLAALLVSLLPLAAQAAMPQEPFSVPAPAHITRAQAAQELAPFLGSSTPDSLADFWDVPTDSPYRPALAQAVGAGLFRGFRGSLRPEDALTQQELSILLCRLWCKPEPPSAGASAPVSLLEFRQALADSMPGGMLEDFTKTVLPGPGALATPGRLFNVVVLGDLLLCPMDGPLTLDNVQVLGDLIVRSPNQLVLLTGTTRVRGKIILGRDAILSANAQAAPRWRPWATVPCWEM